MNYLVTRHIISDKNSMFVGIFSAILSAVCFSGMVFIINDVRNTYSAVEITFFRTLSLVLLIFPYLKLKHIQIFKGLSKSIYLRSIFGSLGLILNFISFQKFPISLASFLLSSLTLLFTVIGGALLLGETLSFKQILGMLGCSLAIYIYNGAQLYQIDTGLIIYPLLGSFFSAAAFLSLRRAASKHHFLTILFFLSFVSLTFSCFLMDSKGFAKINWQDFRLHQIVLLGFSTQYFLTLSFKFLNAGVATLYGQSSIVWTYLIDMIFGGANPKLGQFTAIGLLLFCFILCYQSPSSSNSHKIHK